MKPLLGLVVALSIWSLPSSSVAEELPPGKEYINSMGLRLVRIEAGDFTMGKSKAPVRFEILPHTGGRGDRMDSLLHGKFDEKPAHRVEISRPFLMGIYEVTNFQYELFDPSHKALRGKERLSKEDDEAAIWVNWYEAQAFCDWLSEKEGRPYRLPTEAEWEYACRAGTHSTYFTGETLPKEDYGSPGATKCPEPAPLHVGQRPPNAWGLFDMHGNVEEWCSDWYGPYVAGTQVDPIGYASGQFRVSRGGSIGTQVYALRSANRQGALPETRNWIQGFRVVLGEAPQSKALPEPPPPRHQQDVIQRSAAEATDGAPPSDEPYFHRPRVFVNIPYDANGPLFSAHNHDPAVVECPNGDVLAMWYTCASERNRELGQAASRLRKGEEEWELASPFFDVPDRNDHAPSLWFDGKNTIYHFTGVSFAAEHGCMALAMRTSDDSGATWSRARLVMPDFNRNHMPSEPVIGLQGGGMAIAQDGQRTLLFSYDKGNTWTLSDAKIRGNHPGVVQLRDGRLYGLGRSNAIDGKMPQSVSADLGKTFTYSASPFPPIGGGQRLVLLRLREGPLFLASFADKGISLKDSSGKERTGRGLFTAISTDEGKTWGSIRLLAGDAPPTVLEGMNGGVFTLSRRNAEERGYLAGCQGLDGVIHLISSNLHYAFNLKFLTTPQAPPSASLPVQPVVETFAGPDDFDTPGWAHYKGYEGGFNGAGQYLIRSGSRSNGLNRIVGKGSFDLTVKVRDLEFHPPARRTTPGFTLRLRDALAQSLSCSIRRDYIAINGTESKRGAALFHLPPKSASLRFVYTEPDRRCRVYYGLGDDEPTWEVAQSVKGLYFDEPLSDATAVFLVEDQGAVSLDHFELKKLSP